MKKNRKKLVLKTETLRNVSQVHGGDIEDEVTIVFCIPDTDL